MSEAEKVQCAVCDRGCVLAPGQTGACRARINKDGAVVSKNYGQITSAALDPIEKKPLAEFCPGSMILSVGSYGCNFTCPFCQNHEISMHGAELPTETVTPEQLVEKAVALKPYGNIGIAFTYNEPLVSWEFVNDTAKLAHEAGLKTVVVTNGSINPEIFKKVAQNIDAFNIDLKGMNIYDSLGGKLSAVEENIKTAAKTGHVEVTTLVIPGVNDSDEEIEKIAAFLASVDPNIVLHITRFFPAYKMRTTPPTPVETIYHLADVARKYLKHVYVGNV